MFAPRRVPVPWLQLTWEKTRLMVALAGVAFADLLLFLQSGLQEALYDTAVQIHEHLQADLVLVHPGVNNLIDINYPNQDLAFRRLQQARALPEVQSVAPLYAAYVLWKNPYTARNRPLILFGVDPQKPAFALPEVTDHLEELKHPDTVLFDRKARVEYGPIVEKFNQGVQISTEVNNRRIQVGGLFTLGGSIFSADGLLIASDLNYSRLTQRSLDKISLGLITLKPGADRAHVQAALIHYLPHDVRVITRDDFINLERKYWQNSSPIGYIFALGVVVGFIVGSVIVYQILYSDVSIHLPEYATLKAIGYTNGYLLRVVFQEASILSVLGYIPGFFLSLVVYQLVNQAARLPVVMTLDRAVLVLGLTFLMCFGAGALAVRKLKEADPADIFS
ncbi:ABC transporter permease DevC [Anthocerotibacter panamensis]|uniref:ABC transporter permease DevC n=1 Tax=Anthocerotibacter panamensis TaxID=2857077 RepID=UPI0036F3FA3A